ncbi:MAG: CUAEP/CCAEP-tail radical SAM protein [Gammaproteobacteria bacterium]|nr:CUAEP/CCAEP-tail radical SAM protein [Gammaproteobacteria bacterium]
MKVVLINPYELGRQPFALAQPAAWLRADGFEVKCLDLSIQRLDADDFVGVELIAVYLGMHTATRLAMQCVPRLRQYAPGAHLCAFGLYAPMNQAVLHELGFGSLLGGESEPVLHDLAVRLREGTSPEITDEPIVTLAKVPFRIPDRSDLPPLSSYAHLNMPDGTQRTVGFAEASRGCKHLCRHCPVVPVYNGRFRIVPVDVVLGDIAQQVAAGATHISFGDPDFLNGPTHARRIVSALQRDYPQISFDATIKVEHLINHAELLPELAAAGCMFVTSAVESVDDAVLTRLDKGHNAADFNTAVGLLRDVGIAMSPTFVPFTPWTTLDGYIALLRRLIELDLVYSVPPVQLAIRLLIPEGSYLLRLDDIHEVVDPFDPEMLGYPWRHANPTVDALQRQVEQLAATEPARPREELFAAIWDAAHAAAGRRAPTLSINTHSTPIPHLSEAWYCCAEPTSQQLASF